MQDATDAVRGLPGLTLILHPTLPQRRRLHAPDPATVTDYHRSSASCHRPTPFPALGVLELGLEAIWTLTRTRAPVWCRHLEIGTDRRLATSKEEEKRRPECGSKTDCS